MRKLDFTAVRKNLGRVIDEVVARGDVTVIVRSDAPDAVVMSRATYDSIMETAHLLRSPANARHLARSIAQFRARSPSLRKRRAASSIPLSRE
jgi:antitoxin YefM